MAYLAKNLKGWIVDAAFDLADVGAVDVSPVRKLLLGDTQPRTASANVGSDVLAEGVVLI